MAAQKRLLYMATVWPEASSSAAGVRSMGMLESLLQQGWQVTVSSACKPNAFMQQLQVRRPRRAPHSHTRALPCSCSYRLQLAFTPCTRR